MLNKSRALAFGVMAALGVALAPAPAERVEPVARAGQNFDKGWSAASPTRKAAGIGGEFDLSWFTVDGGGGKSGGGGFVVRGTIGQPDAGTLSGGGFELRGGFGLPAAGCGSCPTDSDGSGDTEAFDLAILLGAWGPVTSASACLDADESGFIEAFDLAVLLGAWGPCE